ncbi:toprim domain-containing protein [Blastococcus sp. VKM Ac-2987]|uniref:toprim domain-containing protein n=1 Tax=Blastococcus sp. VKM Ac-2987 TaxID=3004141 RepID=UPI0022AB990A|nr:toprim domain-containing protein [Blastococcus sp. VKM Ac-2987]MCZ2857419.1 toprim domain-containing protein [Blastococcus sp. VKM Ac-2987]
MTGAANSTAWERVTGRLTKKGSGYLCPAHDDSNPSLSVTPGDGKVLVKCQAGCTFEQITTALDLSPQDFFDTPLPRQQERPQVVATYPYTDEAGELLCSVARFQPGLKGEKKTFRPVGPNGETGKGVLDDVRRVLYRLPEVMEAAASGRTIYVVEGEKDADALVRAGEVATCNIGGAGKWRAEYVQFLRGAQVVIVADRDGPGREHARDIAKSLEGVAKTVRVVEAAQGKDAADHLAQDGTPATFVEVDLEASASESISGLPPPSDFEPPVDGSSDDELPATSWQRVDLTEALKGQGTPQPVICDREDGQHLFYAGKVHDLKSEPEAGKTWFALHAVKGELRKGNRVLYLDHEDEPLSIVGKVQALGVEDQAILDRFIYMQPTEPLTPAAAAALAVEISRQPEITLVVIDGVTDAMGSSDLDPEANKDIRAWMTAVPKAIAK